MPFSEVPLLDALSWAIRLISEHPEVALVESPIFDPQTRCNEVRVTIKVSLPSRWLAKGISPNGVRSLEPVTLVFPPEYPIKPPIVYLRFDFDRSHPHIQPGPVDYPPRPCLVDGNLGELLHHRGLVSILDQLVEWLNRAAMDNLINPEQGWEPVRRDGIVDCIVADADNLRSWVDRRGGFVFLPLSYRSVSHSAKEHEDTCRAMHYLTVVGQQRLTLGPDALPQLLRRRIDNQGNAWGASLGILAWPGKQSSGELIFADRYLPETVSDFQGLIARATEYGCKSELDEAFSLLSKRGAAWNSKGINFPVAVILIARRPYNLIGSDSPLEICPYLMEIQLPTKLTRKISAAVRPVGHLHMVSRPLLARVSGKQPRLEAGPWVLIGCGSLGSKVALHLARLGDAPQVLIDNDILSPHNVARHASLPLTPPDQAFWMGYKAEALAKVINCLGQSATSRIQDICTFLQDARGLKKVLPKDSWALVNTTASLVVREALSAIPSADRPRVIEAALFAAGKVGIIAVEGPEGNPNVGDLISEFYHLAGYQALTPEIFEKSAIRRQEVGQGCGSATMVMTDARVSLHAAGVAEALGILRQEGLPAKGGLLWVGQATADGLGLVWEQESIPPCQIVACEGHNSWRVRISDRACRLIQEEVDRHPMVETGGILIGRYSEVARTFYVTDVLSAPPDSKRNTAEFILGTEGVRYELMQYVEASGGSLYCLGTWHSHLQDSPPSTQDRTLAEAVAPTRLYPSVLLIHATAGFRALMASAKEGINNQYDT
jgi:hypothetical protein